MLLQFSKDPSGFPGGEVYAIGKDYLMDRFETCLWIRREVVDMKSLRAAPDMTDALIASCQANLRKGARLTMAQVITALQKETAP
jgi:hypothetical protein